MSNKKRSPVVDYLVYVAVRCLACFIQTLSWEQARGFANNLAWLAYRIDKRHREVARNNIRQAFPDQYSEEQIDQMIRGVYKHFATLLMEIVLVPRKLRVHNYKKHIELMGGKEMVRALLSDRPLLIVTAHYGNWELAGYFLGLCGFTTYAIARTLDNPYLDQFLRKFREHTGQHILAKKGDFDQIQHVLASGGVMATLGDQDAGKRGQFVDFFGRPASTHKAVALMALEYNVPMIVSVARKVKEPLHYEIVVDEIIDPEDYAGRPDAIAAITQRFTEATERIVREEPGQYFWLHNRWKHQPPTRKKKNVAA